jgi:hypothetical protein
MEEESYTPVHLPDDDLGRHALCRIVADSARAHLAFGCIELFAQRVMSVDYFEV